MRICLASIHPRAMSGQIEGLVGLAKELKHAGHTLEVVTAFGDQLLLKDRLVLAERDDGLLIGKVRRIGNILINLVKQAGSADVVHLNLPTPAFAILGDLVQQFVTVPVVVGFEAHLAEAGNLQDILDSIGFYLPRLLVNNSLTARCTAHRAARYLVSSKHQAKELRRLGFPASRISVLPNVIEADKLQRVDRDEARRKLDLPEGQIVAYVGHYHHVKGVDILVKAFGQVASKFPDCRLVLAWSGLGDPAPIERAAEAAGVGDRILHLGRVPIGTVLSAADVLALPYRYTMGQNAYPGLVLEGMAVGVPLVTSNLPLLRELIEHKKTGLLAKSGDPSSVAREIGRLLGDETLATTMVAEQRRVMAESLDPTAVAKRYVQVYREVCSVEEPLNQEIETYSGRGTY